MAIEQFLGDRVPPSVRVAAANPTYVFLRTRFGVRLRPGCDPRFYLGTLQDDLKRFLSPWAYDAGAEIDFGGRVNASLIVAFVESRPYVDYMASLELFTSLDDVNTTPLPLDEAEGSWIPAGGPTTILVSSRAHDIDLITADRYVPQSFIGISFMIIGLDFKVA